MNSVSLAAAVPVLGQTDNILHGIIIPSTTNSVLLKISLIGTLESSARTDLDLALASLLISPVLNLIVSELGSDKSNLA